jgi:hypothetical protein
MDIDRLFFLGATESSERKRKIRDYKPFMEALLQVDHSLVSHTQHSYFDPGNKAIRKQILIRIANSSFLSQRRSEA